MKNYPHFLKSRIAGFIGELAASRQLYVKNPETDFTRNRKLPFESVMQLIISMGGNSIYKELLEASDYDVNTATTSAFVQQRSKILPEAFGFLLHKFTRAYEDLKRHRDYRLLAVDGSDLHIPTNPSDPETYFRNQYGDYNHLHLNALYDLENRLYVDAVLQPKRREHERAALNDMVDRSRIGGKVIILGDRNYEGYNCFAHIENKGWNYLIRVKDLHSNGILSGLSLPNEDEFDVCLERILTRKQPIAQRQPHIYKFMPSCQNFDFLPVGSGGEYSVSLRIVRFMLPCGKYESVVTNLPQNEFSPSQLKHLYALRWGIETSFRALKYTVGLANFHTKKRELICQEIFARLIMYNFAEMITAHVIVSQAGKTLVYQVNFTVAVNVCRRFLRSWGNAPPLDVEALISKNILPVRPNRKFVRKSRPKRNASFLYRIA
jgi:hypothetical protein